MKSLGAIAAAITLSPAMSLAEHFAPKAKPDAVVNGMLDLSHFPSIHTLEIGDGCVKIWETKWSRPMVYRGVNCVGHELRPAPFTIQSLVVRRDSNVSVGRRIPSCC